MGLSLPVKIWTNYVLRRFGPEFDFTCVNHLDWGFNFATKMIINTFFNNRLRGIGRKGSVKAL